MLMRTLKIQKLAQHASAIALFAGLGWMGDVWAAGVAGLSPEMLTLIRQCAPTVHPETMAALVSAESRGQQFAIADAGPRNLPWAQRKSLVRSYSFSNVDAAVGMASGLIARGHTVSLGIAQVNDRNLGRLGLSLRQAFEPCTNLAAGGKILTDFYGRAVRQYGAGERALRAALSAYNSGDWVRGERDGYVRLVMQQKGRSLALRRDLRLPGVGGSVRKGRSSPVFEAADPRPFGLSSSSFVVFER